MKIRVGLSRTIKLGTGNSYEFLKPSIEIEDDLQLETPQECYLRLTKLCHRLLAKEIRKFESANTEHTEENSKPE